MTPIQIDKIFMLHTYSIWKELWTPSHMYSQYYTPNDTLILPKTENQHGKCWSIMVAAWCIWIWANEYIITHSSHIIYVCSRFALNEMVSYLPPFHLYPQQYTPNETHTLPEIENHHGKVVGTYSCSMMHLSPWIYYNLFLTHYIYM